jgi:hypothetical protein
MRNLLTAAALTALAVALSGCAMSPRPARTEVTPGESEIKSEREERRPSETHLRIRATTPPAPVPDKEPVRIRILVPRQEGPKGGAE